MAIPTNIFGLMQDGGEIKVAHLVVDKERVVIQNLLKARTAEEESTKSTESLFQDQLSSLDFDFDFDDDVVISDSTDPESHNEPQIPGQNEEFHLLEEKQSVSLGDLAQDLNFEQGAISLNLDISNVAYKDLKSSSKASKKKILKEMKQSFYDDENPGVLSFAHFSKSDNSAVGISHEGKMELLENLIGINRSLSKKRYHYSYIQTNEIALINALKLNYSINSEDISAIIYIGLDYSRITLTKGYDFLLDLPIINEGSQSKDVINTVYSRLMLERSHLNLTFIANYFLAGDKLDDSMIEFIYSRQPDSQVNYLNPLRLMEQEDYQEKYSEKTLAEFIVPIMLATIAAFPKESSLIRTNFLPKQLKEQQNLFSISTEGFLVLGLTLIVGLLSINLTLKQREQNSKIKLENTNLKSQIQVTQAVLDSVYVLSAELKQLEDNLNRIKNIVGDKNQWHYILNKISESFNSNRLSWISSIHDEGKGFRVVGRTTNRRNIIVLAELFDGAVIRYVNEDRIQDHTIWNFEIYFDLPEPKKTKQDNEHVELNSQHTEYDHLFETVSQITD
ncbi:MAG: hypothetical protein WCX83_02685 [Candidatus Cloacimonas sp.]|nr:hypothetical protein [Candidatus Cloacimonadota bacterium]